MTVLGLLAHLSPPQCLTRHAGMPVRKVNLLTQIPVWAMLLCCWSSALGKMESVSNCAAAHGLAGSMPCSSLRDHVGSYHRLHRRTSTAILRHRRDRGTVCGNAMRDFHPH